MPIEVDYQETLDYLYSFVDYSLTRNLRYSPEQFNLGRMTALMADLGNPHQQYPVVHVAGTKGKGSTAAMIASVLQAAGYKVGFYTSPHLEDFTERIQINRLPISHSDLVSMVAQLKPSVARIERLTTFELTTAAGFLYFAREKVDIAVIEVGLGGRLDSTNIVDPLVSVITSLSMDHMNVLGDTLEKIAFEKAGIIKPGKPVVVSPQKPEALKVLEDVAVTRGAELFQVGKEVKFTLLQHSLEGQTIHARAVLGVYNFEMDFRIPLLGFHQVENATTAFGTLAILQKFGWKISDEAVHKGFETVSWPGRFEVLQHNPLIVVDSAHNRDSAEKLRRAVDDYFPNARVIMIFGASEDKDIAGMFAELLPRVERLITTQSVHPRAYDAEKLRSLASSYPIKVEAILPVEKAVERALELAKENQIILATGSLFIVGGVKHTLEHRDVPPPRNSSEYKREAVK